MPTITMRQLKQNPQAAVSQVLAADTAFHLTSRGVDTGVVMLPAGAPRPQPFVSGAALRAALGRATLSRGAAKAWLDDIRVVTVDDEAADPWEHRDTR